jgi:5,5'-dehydrodivanillate O-demethylase
MLSKEDNQLITSVAPGTPGGELLRRYWHPIAAAGELDRKPTKAVTLLGEELVLYQDRAGALGLIGRRCPHRRVSLVYGVPEEDGLRCQYHGWKFDARGQCIEAPFEDTVNPEARFRDRIKIVGYPVQELCGLVFAYLGPQPAPLLPRWGSMVWDNAVRDIAITELPCNWLQCQENSLDPVHTEWLHGYYGRWAQTVAAGDPPPPLPAAHHAKIGFDRFEYGIIKRRVYIGGSEEDDDWKAGHPILFPNILQVGSPYSMTFQWRVPRDETHTFHVSMYIYRAAPGKTAPEQRSVPYRYVPLLDEEGEFTAQTYTFNQDYMAWATQGDVALRDQEKLGESDTGIIMFRKMLQEQMDLVQDGGEPVNVFRDPSRSVSIDLPIEEPRLRFMTRIGQGGVFRRALYLPQEAGYSADAALIERVMRTYLEHEPEQVPAG